MRNLAQIYHILKIKAPIEYLNILKQFYLVRFEGNLVDYNSAFMETLAPFCKKGIQKAKAYPELTLMPQKKWYHSLLLNSDLYIIKPVLNKEMLDLLDIEALRKFAFDKRLTQKDASINYIQKTIQKLVFVVYHSNKSSYLIFESWAETKDVKEIKPQLDMVFQKK